MFRGWTGWMLRTAFSVVVISGLTVFTTWKLVEMYADRFVDRLRVPEQVRSMTVGELLALWSEDDPDSPEQLTPIERITQGSEAQPVFGWTRGAIDGAEEPIEGADEANAGTPGRGGEQSNDGMNMAEGRDQEADSSEAAEGRGNASYPEDDETSTDAVTDDSSEAVDTAPASGDDRDRDELVMSSEQFLMMHDQLSAEDKAAIFMLLISNVPQEEFQTLSYMLEDGVTNNEADEIYKLITTYLSEEEVRNLSSIIQKYE